MPRLLSAVEAAFRVARPADLEVVRTVVEQLALRARDPEVGPQVRRALASLVDGARARSFLGGLTDDQVPGWLGVLLPAMAESDYTVGTLLRSRAQELSGRPALRALSPEPEELDGQQVLRRARELAAGFVALTDGDPDARVALLSENRLETALCDLACLSHGIVDVPVPANAANDQVRYALRHSKAKVVVVADEAQLARVLAAQASLPDLAAVVATSRGLAERHGLLGLDGLIDRGGRIPQARLEARAAAVRSSDLATVMYTSGTTGTPKGIAFTHHNLVSKRLCRSFALPFLGEGDVFLSYLPLFHTFGRWLELLGTLWIGSQYVFARSPALSTLLEDFAAVQPTVFISVPQKWLELHERAAQEAGGEDDADRVADRLRALTGGRLRFGLSAAGYLDPRVFRAFQRAGVELCSGYGMTEATGGVTMTPPGDYVEGSIGKPLPGIELLVERDGELSLRGPYVMKGYDRPPDGDTGIDADGWFRTGDLVAVDERGHYRLTGRKKEIYKSLKGQTIAPQRVENLFRDFDVVAQAFLVGDGREFNTLLVWPNFAAHPALEGKEPESLRALLGSLVVSANRFLAPYERVVDFAVLDRPLDEAHGELTPKGSFRREAVEEHFRQLIEPMYRSAEARLPVKTIDLVLPHWLLRELGALREDVSLEDGWLRARGRRLRVEEREPGVVLVGDLGYRPPGLVLDLGAVAGTPARALGNDGLRAFLGEATFFALLGKRRGGAQEVRVDARCALAPPRRRAQELVAAVEAPEVTVESLHAAAVLLRGKLSSVRAALQHLEKALVRGGEAAAVARSLLRRCAHGSEWLRRRALRTLVAHEEASRVVGTVGAFVEAPPGAEPPAAARPRPARRARAGRRAGGGAALGGPRAFAPAGQERQRGESAAAGGDRPVALGLCRGPPALVSAPAHQARPPGAARRRRGRRPSRRGAGPAAAGLSRLAGPEPAPRDGSRLGPRVWLARGDALRSRGAGSAPDPAPAGALRHLPRPRGGLPLRPGGAAVARRPAARGRRRLAARERARRSDLPGDPHSALRRAARLPRPRRRVGARARAARGDPLAPVGRGASAAGGSLRRDLPRIRHLLDRARAGRDRRGAAGAP
ncbi:MAG: AMP-binding protein [Myxococcales bacterium]